MKLQFLVLSDTHLGEDTSLLSFPEGRRRLWQALRDLFGDGSPGVRVEELILAGDIPDRTLSSTAQIITQTNAFMSTLGSVLDVGRVVYIPGNHDHTIWTRYLQRRRGEDAGTTPVDGELVVKNGAVVEGAEAAATSLLSLFFGYPDGSLWRAIDQQKKLDLVVANPVYARRFAERTYLFTHGTHFRKDVDISPRFKMLIDNLHFDEILASIKIQSGGDVAEAADLADLERRVAPFVDSLWPSSGANPTPRSDELWYLLTAISSKFDRKRKLPPEHQLFDEHMLATLRDGDRLEKLTPEHDLAAPAIEPAKRYENGSIDRCRRFFLGHAVSALEAAGLDTTPLTFVYGDTHEGGYGRLPHPRGGDLRVYNTGAWVVSGAEHHPPCHVFAVDDAGREYLADLSYTGVSTEDGALLDLAATDVENRKQATSKALKMLLRLL